MGNTNGKFTIPQSMVDSFNTTNTNIIVSSVIKQAQITSANIGLIQNTTISGVTTSGTGSTTIDEMTQNQNAKLSFSSVKASSVVTDSTINIVNGTLDKLSSVDPQVLSDIISSAQSKNSSAFATPVDQVLEMSTRTNTTDLPSPIYTSIRNVITNTLTNTFTVDSISICIAKIVANQTITINNVNVEGTLNIGTISQNQAATLLASCTQLNNTVTKSTTNVLTTLGITVVGNTTPQGNIPTSNKPTIPNTTNNNMPIDNTTSTTVSESSTVNNQYIYSGICSICSIICCCILILISALFLPYLSH
jgi:hypothetical protein